MRGFWVLGVLLLVGCGAGEEISTDDDALTGDVDQDGIQDAFEKKLILEYAPEVRLHPNDWTRPANVDWYLDRTSLRFSHEHCPDHEVLSAGEATQTTLSQQKHATTNFFCGHTSTIESSNDAHGEFFLHPTSDDVHRGIADGSAWKMYAHVKKSAVASGGYDVQFWFFYAYDFFKYGLNHEADWEHITVTTDANGKVVTVWYAQHDYGVRYERGDLAWSGTHPVVYSAIGTHASYATAGEFPTHWPTMPDHTANGGPVWRGWQNVVNVGEKHHPMKGQRFIEYGGRWGAEGLFDARYSTGTAAPMTPTVQGAWSKY